MNRSFQGYSPRTHPLIYDALQPEFGCEDLTPGKAQYATLPFSSLCIVEPTDDINSPFNQSAKISYAIGPDNGYTNPRPWHTVYAAWVATAGVRMDRDAPLITLPADNVGGPADFYATSTPPALSLGFMTGVLESSSAGVQTDSGIPAIAIQKTPSTIEITAGKDSTDLQGTAQIITFSGDSFAFFNNGGLWSQDKSDLVLYYLKNSNRNAIYARFEQDEFAVEYVINDDLPFNLGRLIQVYTDGSRIQLYAKDATDRNVVLYTDNYVVILRGERNVFSVEIESGIYYGPLKSTTLTTDKGKIAVKVSSGEYYSPIQSTGVQSGDQGSLDVSIESGEYN